MAEAVTEILFIFTLVFLNGLFAMAEIALISSRKARLQSRADEGDRGGLSVDGDADAIESGGQARTLEIRVAPGARGGGKRGAEEGNPRARSDCIAESGGVDHSTG